MRVNLFRTISIVFVILSFFSCKREERTSWGTDVFVPIATGRLSLMDIVPDSIFSYDDQGLWHLMLHEDLTDLDLDSIVTIPDTVIHKKINVPFTGGPWLVSPNTPIINQYEDKLLNINGAELREVYLQSGFLEYSIKSYTNAYLVCKYDLPGVTLDGVGVFIETPTQPMVGSEPFVSSGIIDLSNYQINLMGETGYMYNRIFTHLTVTTQNNPPSPAMIEGGDSVVVDLKFIDPVVHYARGYFGQGSYDLSQTVDFSTELNFPAGTLDLSNATTQMHIHNAIGADAQLEFTSFMNHNAESNSSVTLDFSPLYDPINITRAYDNNGTVQGTDYYFQLDNNNSNITQFIENLPNSLTLQGNMDINPLGDITDGHDFIYTNNALTATLDMDIPLNVGVHNLVLMDTLSIGPSIDLEADGEILFYITNTFPFNASVDLSISMLRGRYYRN